MTRGIKRDVDEVVKFLETRSLLLPRLTRDGKKDFMPIQSMIQPIQLWSFVFPENHKDEVLTSLKFDQENIDRWSNKKMKLLTNGLRLALGAQKIPPFKNKRSLYLPQEALENISIIPIGIKQDRYHWDKDKKYFHEAI